MGCSKLTPKTDNRRHGFVPAEVFVRISTLVSRLVFIWWALDGKARQTYGHHVEKTWQTTLRKTNDRNDPRWREAPGKRNPIQGLAYDKPPRGKRIPLSAREDFDGGSDGSTGTWKISVKLQRGRGPSMGLKERTRFVPTGSVATSREKAFGTDDVEARKGEVSSEDVLDADVQVRKLIAYHYKNDLAED